MPNIEEKNESKNAILNLIAEVNNLFYYYFRKNSNL